MKARKLPSGRWQVQPSYTDIRGITHRKSITADTKSEAEYLGEKFKKEHEGGRYAGSVEEMVKNAIEAKAPVLSPATVRGYLKILKDNIRPSPFAKENVVSLRNVEVQQWISWLVAQGYSPKSIKNAYGVFRMSYQFFGGEKAFRVKLPPLNKNRKHVPSEADVHAVLDFFKNDPDMTAAINLCAFGGLRRGEACALTAKDVNRSARTIRINKSMVKTIDDDWITKVPKTASSIREVDVGDSVIATLPKEGRCVRISPDVVTNRFCRAIAALPVEPFSLHDLRHFHASLAHHLGVAEFAIQCNDGWSSPAVMKDIYYGDMKEHRKKQMDIFNDYIDMKFGTGVSAHDSCT